MDIIIAFVLGLILFFIWDDDRTKAKNCQIRWEKFESIWKKLDVRFDWDVKVEVSNLLSNPVTRAQCFDSLDNEMRYIFGRESWRDIFDSFESNWFFQNKVGSTVYDHQYPVHPEDIVYYVMLATRGKIHFTSFEAYKIWKFPINTDTYDILKRMCIVIERLMKSHHPELEHELDMQVCQIDEIEKIKFRFDADSIALKNRRRLTE